MMSYMSSSYVLDIDHYQLSHLQIFVSFCKLSFHFVNGFLCCAKTFKFNKVQFVYFCFYLLCFRRWIQKNIATVDVKECSAMFSSRNFMESGLSFRPLIHFELIFVYGVT